MLNHPSRRQGFRRALVSRAPQTWSDDPRCADRLLPDTWRAGLACQVVRSRDFRLVSSVAFDISAGGMLVLTGERVLTGEPVHVSFKEPNGRRWFDLEAEVVRVAHGRRPTDRGRCLGLSFSGLREFERQRLVDGIRELPLA